MDPRGLAVDSLQHILREGAFSNLETREALSRVSLSGEDKGLYITLVYGTLQNQMYLDYLLCQVLDKPLKRLDGSVRIILEVAAYQIFFLDRIPDYAIVDEAVTLTGKKVPKARGFVNGVLRNILRQKAALADFHLEDWPNEKEGLSIRYSIPQWIVHKYFEVFGEEKAMTILPKMNDTPPFTLRTNTLKITREALMTELSALGMVPEAGTLYPEAIHLLGTAGMGSDINKERLFSSGFYTIQDQGAMGLSHLLDPQPGEQILDMCAAPGGKTTHIAQLMENQGEIIARDIHAHRLALIDGAARRLGISCIKTEKADGTRLNPIDIKVFDRILLDAPCTGTGIIRRKPEIRHRGDKKERKAIRQIQGVMLDHAATMLKDGGVLVYSTCSVNPDENEHQIEMFLSNHPEMQMEPGTMGYTDLTMDGCDSFFHCKMTKNQA
ncbi:16S rRNA (cytosine(967)-C(5))-methyltransferase RsmB [Eubacterium barkeri]|uniref:16S rRNA (cytosine(967)-C(5))-methyltransferase n=1 Tax=Eubacterium barkeri TaxID=1528 RepID=A0A1H3EIN6_EUBBA|nr:16S rRNA (cytosine(967)-C(5))-methyltransferase RsmB [Eubacterium barkeri]SDX78457.1 16S rRNA (cytosine967-C5)-methyltransferase [Eubacterium barkeri]